MTRINTSMSLLQPHHPCPRCHALITGPIEAPCEKCAQKLSKQATRRPVAHLWIQVRLPYQTKTFKALTGLGFATYNYQSKAYDWRFPITALPMVRALTSGFLVPKDEAELLEHYTTLRAPVLKQGKKKGEGLITVIARPTDFMVTWQREGKLQTTYVAAEYVQTLWKVIAKHPLGKKVLTATIAEHFCEAMGFTGFNIGKDGAFSWRLWSGSRKYYLRFWAALKVLNSVGVAEHVVHASQSGVVRHAPSWDVQTELLPN